MTKREEVKIREVIAHLEERLPLSLQESWDNSGLQVGDTSEPCHGVLVGVDVTEELLEEAVRLGCNLIITHHPLLFHKLGHISTSSYIERCVRYAIKHDLVLYAAHTNADNAPRGLNYLFAQRLGLEGSEPLRPLGGQWMQLVVTVPEAHALALQEALAEAGAGRLEPYDSCSFSSPGKGTFRPLAGSKPYIGDREQVCSVEELRLEFTLPIERHYVVERALKAVHPYEVPSYQFYQIENAIGLRGSGVVGLLPKKEQATDFLRRVKDIFATPCAMHSPLNRQEIQKVAICTGAGASFWKYAKRLGADVLITGEARYNDYYDALDGPILLTLGHYESERIAEELFISLIREKFANFAVHRAQCQGPVNYII